MDETLSLLATLVGAIEYRQMLFLQERSALYSHSTASVVVCRFDLIVREAKLLQQVEVWREILLCLKAEALQTLLTQVVYIEYKADLESTFNRSIQLLQLLCNKALLAQALVVDERRAGECAMTLSMLNDGIDLFFLILQIL